MRTAMLTLIGALALGAVTASAQAAPIAPALGTEAKAGIVQVWGGCGWGFHPTGWGCAPNRHGYYRPHGRGYYGGGYPYRHYRYWRGY